MSDRQHSPCKPMRRRSIAFLLVAASIFVSGFQPHSDETIIRNFETVAFGSEHRKTESRFVRKWVAPVRIYLDIRISAQDLIRKLNNVTVDELASVSGHDIRIVDDIKQANVISTFARMDDLLTAAQAHFPGDNWLMRIINTNLCTGRFLTKRNGAIYKAYIFIPTDRTFSRGMLPSCVIEETTQILGLPNDSNDVIHSIFNDTSTSVDLTEHDKTLIRLLYHPRIKAGMSRRRAMELVNRILPDVRK